MYIIIDNYDSFTYNLYQYLCEITDKEVKVFRNDAITDVKQIADLKPEAIIISPGPGRPEDAGISVETIKYFKGKIPILGVCLGHQAIGYAFGAEIIQAKRIVHGKVEEITLDGKGLFRNIASPSRFTRYHSLAVSKDSVPDSMEITAVAKDGEIMGLRHKKFLVEGIQFHPESMASEFGKRLLQNFLHYKRESLDMKEILVKLIKGENMSFDEAESFMDEVTEGNVTNSQLAAYLAAINAKGPAAEEIAGCASILKKKRKRIEVDQPLVDTCGTGGDGLGTFNISSLCAIFAAACGVSVAKHGNRAVSSKSGSADFYKELGIKIDLDPESTTTLLVNTGFAFLFAPLYHKAMKHAVQVRRELGIKTIFNLIGPLSNPAGAEHQLIGVYSRDLCLPVARAARLLGVKRIMVVHGLDGMDEISVSSVSRIIEINEDGEENDYVLDPRTIGVNIYRSEELKGGDAKKNAEIARAILSGDDYPGIREAVLLNTGAALYIAGNVQSIQEGYEKAKKAYADGSVKMKLEQIILESQALT
ncbi:MAG: bifunctional anthranilate synthase component II/anthranilate phosphoribosyltransferase [Spirochaetales bacterium]|nr:bifunctional anthranilate synthase component II/anthranilate phosphoribosyltransferase [Spirochaetales bacterium]